MIKWISQEGGKKKSGNTLNYPKPKAGVVWILAIRPDEAEIKKISKDFSLPSNVIRNYSKQGRSIRYSFEPFACTFVDYHFEDGKIKRENVLFFVGENFIITILNGNINIYNTVYSEIARSKKTISPTDILIELLDDDIEENYDLLEMIENQIADIERALAFQKERSHIERVVVLRRTLNKMSRALWGSSRLTYFLRLGISSLEISEPQRRKIDDLHESIIHQLDIISNYKESLTDAITIYQVNISNWLATISNRINSSIRLLTWVMLILTGLTLVITVPNTLATIFGIPYLALSTGDSQAIVTALVLATIIPTLMFFIYWAVMAKKVKKTEKEI